MPPHIDVLYLFSLAVCGYNFAFLTLNSIKNRKMIILLASVGNFATAIFVMCNLIIYVYYPTFPVDFDAFSVGLYVLAMLIDTFGTVSYQIAVFLRVRAFIVNPKESKLTYLLLFSPCVYLFTGPLATYYLMTGQGITMQATTYFTVSNLYVAIQTVLSHIWMSSSLTRALKFKNPDLLLPHLAINAPILTGFCFGLSSILGMVPGVGTTTGAMAFFWALDICSFFVLNNVVKRHLEGSQAPGKSATNQLDKTRHLRHTTSTT
jgi:hypothetical protein